MRTKEEIEAAIRHLREAIQGSDPPYAAMGFAIADALEWTLGKPSKFSEVIAGCESIDRHANG